MHSFLRNRSAPKVGIPLLLIFAFSVSACLDFQHMKAQDAQGGAVTASFASLKANIFTPRCATCHSGATPPHGVDLSSYQSMVNSAVFPPLVVPGDPDHSSLYQACMTGGMPLNAPHLSDVEMRAIHDWIKNGAQEVEDGNPAAAPTAQPTEPGGNGPGGSVWHEPCDPIRIGNEPGYFACSSEPVDG